MLNRRFRAVVSAAALGGTFLAVVPLARAEGSLFDVASAQAMRDGLKSRIKQPVTLRLAGSDKDMSGTVVAVGDEAVHLTQIGGMEFYDALVRISDIEAILVRRPVGG